MKSSLGGLDAGTYRRWLTRQVLVTVAGEPDRH